MKVRKEVILGRWDNAVQGQTLKIWIIRSGKSQRAVAREIDRPEKWLSDLIHGWATASAEDRQALSRALGRPVDELFGEAE